MGMDRSMKIQVSYQLHTVIKYVYSGTEIFKDKAKIIFKLQFNLFLAYSAETWALIRKTK
jgi:hypothetical protein